jgi:hypothetical protein
MSGETKVSVSGWTTDTLLAYIKALLDERDLRFTQALEAHERYCAASEQVTRETFLSKDALAAARELAITQKFESQEKAVTSAMLAADKATVVAEHTAEKWRLSANEWRGAMDDRERNYVMRSTYEQAILSIKGSHDAAMLGLQKQFQDIKERLDKAEGKGTGLASFWGYVLGAVGLLSTVIGIFAYFAAKGH